ncbi:MAG: type II toxin-antitoxin system RelE/ParE family toxin [Novosphingobium sp.]
MLYFLVALDTAMPYDILVQTVVETPEYLAAAKKAGMTDDERVTVVDFLAGTPDAGEIIPGTGGCRKVRIAKEGKGKSGGYRVITYYMTREEPVFLMTVISKGKQANLTGRQKNELRKGK